MQRLELVLNDPAEQLACDEAMLDWCEKEPQMELLRLWEPVRPFVVLGISNHAARETHLDFCNTQEIPVLRRCTGGGAVLQAPGCLNFTLVMRIPPGEDPLDIHATHQKVLARHEALLTKLLAQKVGVKGTSDLVLGALKFSGNAQKRRQGAVLYHGTFLLSADWDLMEKTLQMPSRKPAYRGERTHREFLTTLPISREQLRDGLVRAWGANTVLHNFPTEEINRLVLNKYSKPEWNLKL